MDAIEQARQAERYTRIDIVIAISLGFAIGLLFCAILIALALATRWVNDGND